MQTQNVDYDNLVRVIGKTLTLPQHEDIILNSMNQTRQMQHFFSKQRYLLNGMKVPLCFHFYLLFRTNGRKEHFSEIKFYHCCGNFLKNVFSESFVESSFLIITRHINNSIRETLQRWRFYGSTYALFLIKLNIMEQKSTKVLP